MVLGLSPCTDAHSEPAPAPLMYLALDLSSDVPLAAATLQQLQHEVERIWTPVGVAVSFRARLPDARLLAVRIIEDFPQSDDQVLATAVAALARPTRTVRISFVRARGVVEAGLRGERRYDVPNRAGTMHSATCSDTPLRTKSATICWSVTLRSRADAGGFHRPGDDRSSSRYLRAVIGRPQASA
jgi:hypothetical protein